MFNNLIESSSHTGEFKRRGSFFLFTTATYALLFVIAGVASIYAYDARLEDQNTEIITMLNPVDLAPPKSVPDAHNAAPVKGDNSRQNYAVREFAMASVNNPLVAPKTASAKPNPNLALPESGIYKIGERDSNPGGALGPGSTGLGSGTQIIGERTPAIEIGTPPPAPVEKRKPTVVHKNVINGEALSLPKPPYPPLAKQMRVQGRVNVQVLIDEHGRVVSANAVTGSPFLVSAAQKAAYEARFSPTFLGEQPVKVSGVITYNFILQ